VHDLIVSTSGCAGLCNREPMAKVELPGKPPVKYVDLTKEKIKKIFEEHVLCGNIILQSMYWLSEVSGLIDKVSYLKIIYNLGFVIL